MPPIISCVEQMTPAAMTALLQHSGALTDTQVIHLDASPIGNGLVGDSIRFNIEYDRLAATAPTSLVAKFPSSDEGSRTTGKRQNLYMKELIFYRDIADTVAVRTPRIHCAAIDSETHEFCLLMEDIQDARSGDQLVGCTPAQAQAVLLQAAALHGPRWGDSSLLALDLLHPRHHISLIVDLYPKLFPAFRERYDGLLDDRLLRIGEQLCHTIAAYYDQHVQPWTVQHGDFRLDNLLFGPAGTDAEVVVLDWQTAMLGPGTVDVAYFLGAGLVTEQRRVHEEELLRGYLDAVLQRGAHDYDWNRCWHDYRLFALQGYIMASMAPMLVERTERGDRMFLTMARRHGEHILDLESLKLFA